MSRQVRVSEKTHRILKLEAANNQTTMLQVIESLIKEHYEID
tara:strand:- start:1913 stop:2038 length:126 start_codon:yes stop_codon:yes gene_type:complete